MLDFISHYPLDHYLKTIIKPKKARLKVACLLSRDYDQMLTRDSQGILYWNPNLRDIPGAPSLEDTFPKKLEGARRDLPSVYKRVLQKEQRLNKQNETMFLIDDPEVVITPYSVTSHENAGELEAALSRDPSSIITAWKNYNHTAEFIWEILDSRCEIVRGNMKLSKKVLLCGFPEQRALQTALWCQSHNQELAAIAPLIPTILKWALAHCPDTGCFFLINSPYEIAISYLEKKEIRVLSTQKTRDGFTADEVSDVQELIEEIGVEKKDAQVWCWDILPGSSAFNKLKSKYPNTKSLTPEELQTIEPLTAKKAESPIEQSKEAWLLNNLLQ